MSPHKVLVTGATGFVGRQLCKRLEHEGNQLTRALRKANGESGVVVGDLGVDTDWSSALRDVDIVVHLAARVHVMNESASDQMQAYREINVTGTLELAKQAADAGVKRFVFLSTVKVNGERTEEGVLFNEQNTPAPEDAYAISKWEAEEGLKVISMEKGIEYVIIRPPLVYGPGVKANFYSLLRLIAKGIPIPLGHMKNKRSFVGLDNLVDFIATCVAHPSAKNQTFMVSDGEDLSTTELARRLGIAMQKPARLIPIPVVVLESIGWLVNRRSTVTRLCDSLQVDISKAKQLLNWRPPVSIEDGLLKTAQYYLQGDKRRGGASLS